MPSWRLTLGSALTIGLVAAVSALIVFAVTWSRLATPAGSEIATVQTSIVYWDDAETEMARLGDTNRISVPLADVPLDVQHAVLAAEDRSFYEHGGFAVKGFLRAVWANLTTGE
jgi:membrane peptidoglycan carboxypeptidase